MLHNVLHPRNLTNLSMVHTRESEKEGEGNVLKLKLSKIKICQHKLNKIFIQKYFFFKILNIYLIIYF